MRSKPTQRNRTHIYDTLLASPPLTPQSAILALCTLVQLHPKDEQHPRIGNKVNAFLNSIKTGVRNGLKKHNFLTPTKVSLNRLIHEFTLHLTYAVLANHPGLQACIGVLAPQCYYAGGIPRTIACGFKSI